MTENQYKAAFTAVGKWAFLCAYEIVKNWDGEDKGVVTRMVYDLGFDESEKWSRSRVNSILRIINGEKDLRALEEIRDSNFVNRRHPEAHDLAEALIQKYF